MSAWAAGAAGLRSDPRAPGLLVGPDVSIAPDAVIGANVVIYGGTRIDAGAQVQDFVSLGKPSVRGTGAGQADQATVVGPGAVVGTGAIVYSGAQLGANSFAADQSVVRDRVRLGERSLLGTYCAIGVESEIGDDVSIQAYSVFAQFTRIEDEVFVGPFVVGVNDNSLNRHDQQLPFVHLRRACRIAGNVQINPGIEIGEEAFVAAASLVTRDVPARAKMLGTPARQIGEVTDAELLENWR